MDTLLYYCYCAAKTADEQDYIYAFYQVAEMAVFEYYEHGRNFVAKGGGDSLVWNQYIHPGDADVKFYQYRFPILLLEVFWKQRQSRFALSFKHQILIGLTSDLNRWN